MGALLSAIFSTDKEYQPIYPVWIGKGSESEKARKRRLAQEKLGMDPIFEYNFGFCGGVKSGKSSLINGMRGLNDFAPGAATVDFMESTTVITGYKFDEKEMQRAVLWDIPGCGTMSFGCEEYFDKHFLYAFDCLLLMLSGSLRTEDVQFARKALEHDVAVLFVRSKCDNDLQNVEEGSGDKNMANIRSAYLQRMKTKFAEEISNNARDLKDVPIFFVSSKAFKDIKMNCDTGKLKYALQEEDLMNFIIHKIRTRRLNKNHTRITFPLLTTRGF